MHQCLRFAETFPDQAIVAALRGQLSWTHIGSTSRLNGVASLEGTAIGRARDKLLASDVVSSNGETVVFSKDHLFTSPSAAAVALLGRTANGWVEWKTESGQTLDETERQSESHP